MDSVSNITTEPSMLEASFHFWFNNQEHIRSPFPEYIREDLKRKATDQFSKWVAGIEKNAQKEVNDEILVEKLEEIIFESALTLVKTDDEKITIKYPFLPRIDDVIKIKDIREMESESKLVSREVVKRGDETFLKVSMLNIALDEKWETEFELPE